VKDLNREERVEKIKKLCIEMQNLDKEIKAERGRLISQLMKKENAGMSLEDLQRTRTYKDKESNIDFLKEREETVFQNILRASIASEGKMIIHTKDWTAHLLEPTGI
jgi:DNA-directed RNA polymerase sigma subunit (sigma70/sigma32)